MSNDPYVQDRKTETAETYQQDEDEEITDEPTPGKTNDNPKIIEDALE